LIGSKSEVLCVGSELDVKSIGAVIEGLDSKGPGTQQEKERAQDMIQYILVSHIWLATKENKWE
jgi:hypothetical protein